MRYKILFFLFTCISFAQCNSYSKNVNYDIKIIINIFGNHKLWEYHVKNDSIIVIKYSMNAKPAEKIVNRKLTDKEKKNFMDFMSIFPLKDLNNSYSNDLVEGEMSYMFNLSVGSLKKDIYVYFKSQKNLKQLCDKIDDLLPQECKIYFASGDTYKE
jgi:hypothetical protein